MKFPSILIAASLFAAVLAMPMAAQENKAKHQKYQLFDLGTFGGPASYTLLNQGGQGTTVLNNRGMVAGSADTPTPDPYAPHCANPDCFVSHTFRWEDGALHDLGTIPSGSTSAATGINARGSIAGFSQNGAIDPVTGLPAGHAVLWTNDDMIDLGTLGGGYESLGVAVNDSGQVVGFGSNLVSDPFFGTQVRTFFWEKGVMTDVGTLGGPDCPPFYNIAINQRGQVVGDCFTNSTPNPITGLPTTDPFLWEKGRGMTDLGTLGGTIGAPASVNDRGQVVGDSNLAGDLVFHPFLWTKKGGMQDLGTFGGSTGLATWINNAGDVVGVADFPGDKTHDGFLWRKGVMTDLGNLGATSYGYAINSHRQVVGASRIDATAGNIHAFLWENGGIVDLNTLIPMNSSLLLGYAVNINEEGEIAGVGVPTGCAIQDFITCGHAFLLIPCDERHADGGTCEDRAPGETSLGQPGPVRNTHPSTPKARPVWDHRNLGGGGI